MLHKYNLQWHLSNVCGVANTSLEHKTVLHQCIGCTILIIIISHVYICPTLTPTPTTQVYHPEPQPSCKRLSLSPLFLSLLPFITSCVESPQLSVKPALSRDWPRRQCLSKKVGSVRNCSYWWVVSGYRLAGNLLLEGMLCITPEAGLHCISLLMRNMWIIISNRPRSAPGDIWRLKEVTWAHKSCNVKLRSTWLIAHFRHPSCRTLNKRHSTRLVPHK